MGKISRDVLANVAAIRVVESAPATQTTAKFAFPFSIMDKVGLLVSRIEYWVPTLTGLNTSADVLYCGLSVAATLSDIANQADPLLVDSMAISRMDMGTAASGEIHYMPFVKDFSNLPGGGLLLAPNPLYGIIQGVGTTPAMQVWVKLFYTYMDLKPEEYWELVESRRIISS